MVLGRSGSGKTFFSNKLGKITGIEVFHLDKLYYNPDWTHAYTREDFAVFVNKIILEEEWIIDGNYSMTIDERVKRADVIVFFNIPFYKSLYFIVKRVFFPTPESPDRHEGMREKVDWSLIEHTYRYPTETVIKRISKNSSAQLYIIKNRKESEALLASFK